MHRAPPAAKVEGARVRPVQFADCFARERVGFG